MQKSVKINIIENKILHLKLANNIIKSFLNKNEINSDDLPNMITEICECINGLHGKPCLSSEEVPASPSVDPKESIFEDYIICLEDGRPYKTLKRALMSRFGLTPDEYRRKWNLRADNPLVAPASAKKMAALSRMEKDETETR